MNAAAQRMMQPFFDQASPLEKVRTNRHLSELRRGKRKGGPKLEIPHSELLMYGVTNQNIKEKLGKPIGAGSVVSDLTRQKITFQVTGEDSLYQTKQALILHGNIHSISPRGADASKRYDGHARQPNVSEHGFNGCSGGARITWRPYSGGHPRASTARRSRSSSRTFSLRRRGGGAGSASREGR
jgi:hypothetical protein